MYKYLPIYAACMLLIISQGTQKSYAQDTLSTTKIHAHSRISHFLQSVYNYDFVAAKAKIKADNDNMITVADYELKQVNYYWWLIVSGEYTGYNVDQCNRHLDNAMAKLKNAGRDTVIDYVVYSSITINAFKARLEIFTGNKFRAMKYLYAMQRDIEIALEKQHINYAYKFIAGLYNYFSACILDQYPLLYPYFLIFPKGNKNLGINQLENCLQSSDVFVKSEATYFLMKIYMEFEQDYSMAAKYVQLLSDSFPKNQLFQYYYCKILLNQNKTEEAVKRYKRMKHEAFTNMDLTENQKSHFVQIAKADFEAKNIHLNKIEN